MLVSLLRRAPRDPEELIPLGAATAPKALADVGHNGLRGGAQLYVVNESRTSGVEQLIYLIYNQARNAEKSKVIGHAPICMEHSITDSSFHCAQALLQWFKNRC